MNRESKILWGITIIILILMVISFLFDGVLRRIIIGSMLILVGIEEIIIFLRPKKD